MDARVNFDVEFQEQPAVAAAPKIVARDVNVYYGDKHALKGVNVDIPERSVTAFIGPSGCGKSTFLRCINRMNDTIPICRVTGKITIAGEDIYDRSLDVVQLRARVGMVFQQPNAHPWLGQEQRGAGGDRGLQPAARRLVRGGEGSPQ